MGKITFSSNVIIWAIERRGLTIADIKKRFPKIEKWLDGSISPTLKQIEDLARITATPFGYFFLQQPPVIDLPIPHFRTVDDGKPKTPSPDLYDTVQTMELRQDWVKEFLTKRGVEPREYVGCVDINENVVNAAATIKQALSLDNTWASQHSTWTDALRGLRNAMEDIGILVVINGVVGNNTSRALDPKEFRGFVLSDNFAPLVFVNGADSKAAQMFTLAHELAHIFLGKSAAFDLKEMLPANDPSERLCNAIAAEVLVPQDELRKLWNARLATSDQFSNLARYFKVSPLVVGRRALDLRLVKRDEFFDFYNLYLVEWAKEKAKLKKKDGGGDFYLNQNLRVGKTLGEFVVKAVKEGSILYSDAYRLTGLSGSSFDKFAQSRGLKKTGSG